MAKNIERKIDKPDFDIEKKEAPVVDTESLESSREDVVEKEPGDVEKAESKKPLEKIGEALSSRKKKASDSKVYTPNIKRQEEIDRILSEGLDEVFLSMSPEQQKEFTERGEMTVKKINKLLESTKVKIAKVIKLIKNWLRTIPKVNSYFLEQEAKIKADKIIKLKK
jgi:hypothetical protein